jgi:hypothetical protein
MALGQVMRLAAPRLNGRPSFWERPSHALPDREKPRRGSLASLVGQGQLALSTDGKRSLQNLHCQHRECCRYRRQRNRTAPSDDEGKRTARRALCRLYLRVQLNSSFLPSRRGQPLDGLRPASQMTPGLFHYRAIPIAGSRRSPRSGVAGQICLRESCESL